MKKVLFAALSVFVLGALPHPAIAGEGDFISLGVGYYDILDDDGAVDFRAEYRPNKELIIQNLKPWVGLEVTSDSSVWGGVGILYDLALSDNVYLTPSFGAGLYAQGSSDKDLDYPLEFRSQIELAHQYTNGHRTGIAFGHISNASLGDDNPGTEILNLYWHIPY